MNYGTEQAAELLGVSLPTLRKLLRQLHIERVQSGRDTRKRLIREADFERLRSYVDGLHAIETE